MEKRITFVEFQSVKSVAKAVDPYLRTKERIEAQINGLDEEFKQKEEQAILKLKEKMQADKEEKRAELSTSISNTEAQIAAIEAGIVKIIGFHVTDLVKKVIEPDAKGGKVTKYLPTDKVSYDTKTKEYVITTPDEAENAPSTEEMPWN